MNRSDTIGKVMDALRLAQLDFDPVLKDARNPLYNNSKYATLSGVITATSEALAKHELVISQLAISDLAHQGVGVTTLLAHSSGEFIASDLLLPAIGKGKDKTERYDAQTGCGAITYARRYAYLAIIGVAAEDDDGNQASGHGRQTRQDAPSRAQEAPRTTQAPASTPNPPKADVASDGPPASSVDGPLAPSPDDGTLPTEDELKVYREMFRNLGVSLKGVLHPSAGLPINKKIECFLLKITNAKTPKDVTRRSWDDFFKRVAHVKGLENGLEGLAKLINKANGVEKETVK